jgi:hypothetical protein
MEFAPAATFVRGLMFVGVPLPITDDFLSRRLDGQANGFVVMASKSRDLDQDNPA